MQIENVSYVSWELLYEKLDELLGEGWREVHDDDGEPAGIPHLNSEDLCNILDFRLPGPAGAFGHLISTDILLVDKKEIIDVLVEVGTEGRLGRDASIFGRWSEEQQQRYEEYVEQFKSILESIPTDFVAISGGR